MTPVSKHPDSELDGFIVWLAATARQLLPADDAFVLVAPRHRFDAYLNERPEIADLLARGEHVSLPPSERKLLAGQDSAVAEESSNGFSSLLLVPVVFHSTVEAVLCLALREESGVSAEQLASLRALCRLSGPLIAGLRELELLRHENSQLRRRVQRLDGLESAVKALEEARCELEAVLQLKTLRTWNFVHDLSTPVQTIQLYARMLTAGVQDGAAREQATMVNENVLKLVRVIRQFRHMENQAMGLQGFDLRELWQEALGLVRPQAEQRSIRISERIPAEPFHIVGDRQRLGKVVTELALNAAKFTEAGGEIVIEFAREEREVVVRVSDTGIGIPPEVLEKVSDRYEQNDAEGRAAGLSVLHEIVRLHGGKITVGSKVGQGSTFTLRLPVIQTSEKLGERTA